MGLRKNEITKLALIKVIIIIILDLSRRRRHNHQHRRHHHHQQQQQAATSSVQKPTFSSSLDMPSHHQFEDHRTVLTLESRQLIPNRRIFENSHLGLS